MSEEQFQVYSDSNSIIHFFKALLVAGCDIVIAIGLIVTVLLKISFNNFLNIYHLI